MKFSHFRIAVVSTIFIFITNISIAQIDTSTVYAQIPRDHKSRIINDPKSHVKYILDTSHVYIEAVAPNGSVLWKTNPWKDPDFKFPQDPGAINNYFGLRNDSVTHFADVIEFASYISGGRLDVKTGRVIWSAQD